MKEKVCKFIPTDDFYQRPMYKTSCDSKISAYISDNYKYCPHCGGKIEWYPLPEMVGQNGK